MHVGRRLPRYLPENYWEGRSTRSWGEAARQWEGLTTDWREPVPEEKRELIGQIRKREPWDSTVLDIKEVKHITEDFDEIIVQEV